MIGVRSQIEQVLINLISNSINYTPEGGRIDVHINWAKNGGVDLTVTDSGIGISEEEQAHLFTRFYRGRQASTLGIPGTGLGLSIVQEIVDLHKGRISVESVPGEGSIFRVWLPSRRRTQRKLPGTEVTAA